MIFGPHIRPVLTEIVNPSTGHFSVGVEVDAKALEADTSALPNIGDAITSIGLPANYTAKYSASYTLQEIQPQKGGGFLLIFEKLDGFTLSGVQLMGDGEVATVTKQSVAAGETIRPDYYTASGSIQPTGAGKGVKELVVVPEWPETSGYQYDEFLDKYITLSKRTVPPGTSPDSSSSGSIIMSSRDDIENKWRSIRIQAKLIGGLPSPREEYKQGSWSAPALLRSAAIVTLIEDEAAAGLIPSGTTFTMGAFQYGTAKKRMVVDLRAARSSFTQYKTTTTFHIGDPGPPSSDSLNLQTKHMIWRGYSDTLDFGIGLCNAITQSTPGVDTSLMPPSLLAGILFTITASTPTAEAYIGYAGTWQNLPSEKEYWKSGIWITRAHQVLIPA